VFFPAEYKEFGRLLITECSGAIYICGKLGQEFKLGQELKGGTSR
jgi:hypothetical protein